MALNEKVFRCGRETRRLGFVLTVGASNRLPEDEALAALFDRFLLRVRSENVPSEMLTSVLEAGWKLQQAEARQEAVVAATVSMDDLRLLQRCIPSVDVSTIRTQYVALINRLRHASIDISDRRAVRLQRLTAASALTCGRMIVHQSDLWVLRYIWETMEQVEVLAKIVDDAIRADAPGAGGAGPSNAQCSTHPRSAGADAPNSEHLSKDLDQIESQLSAAEKDSNQTSWLRDCLSLLLARVE